PGYWNTITMPIKNRVDMVSTGIRTPVGIKVFGPRLDVTQHLAEEIEQAIKEAKVKGTGDVAAERTMGGYYLNITPNRDALARYELSVTGLQEVIETAIGGNVISTTVEGRERYPINIRYLRELRDSPEMLKRVLIRTPMGYSIPLSQVADISLVQGPDMIRSERGQLTGTVYVDMGGRDVGSYVAQLQKIVSEKVPIPQGYSLVWSGQYEYMARAHDKLKLMIPFTLFIIFLLIYMNFGDVTKTLIVMLSVPFALVGGILTLAYLKFNLSVAVWVGIIALAGVAAETGVVMLVYIDEAYERSKREGKMNTMRDLYEAIIEGSVQRVRPKMMTVVTIMAGLLPILWSHGTGADVMKRIAAPMIGGMLTSTLLTLFVIPSLYYLWKSLSLKPARR
ncbi:MAG: efflux RND transporter permease subunit, partial [bacterium]